MRLLCVVLMIDEAVEYAFRTTGITIGFAIIVAYQIEYYITVAVGVNCKNDQ